MRTRGDAYVYLRYRCHHCRKLGERYIPIEEWNPRSLNWTEPEMTAEEEQRFAGLGPITEAEIRSMRKALSTLRRIPHNDDSP
ncbi:MAG: hypothetical protein HUU17_02405 [Chthonomonadales bacterium]|nr:hypothetical protein [Chthonomonadales bacterium]